MLAAGFDAIVNERANRMTWPKGQMRYNIATLAELRTFRPLAYTLDLDGEQRRLEAMLVAVGNGPSFGGGLRITEGALLDDGLLDVVIIKPMSKAGLVRTYPKLFKGTHVTHPQYEHHRVRSGDRRRAGHRRVRRRRAVRRRCPLTVECAPGALTSWHDTSLSPSERYASYAASGRRESPGAARLRRAVRLRARRVPGRGVPPRSRRATACWSPRRPARARRWSASSRSTWRCETGRKCFYTTPIKALSNQKFHDLVDRYGADRVGLLTGDNTHQRRGAGRGDDHRGAAQHAVRRLAAPCSASATS